MEGAEDPPDYGGTDKQTDLGQQTERTKFEYVLTDMAPYRVYFELKSGNNGARINRYSLGSKLRSVETFKRHIVDMKQISRSKIMVVLNSYSKANLLVETINNENGIYTAYIPKHVVCISGVIAGIPTEITTEQIKADLECDVPVFDVYRLNRYEEGRKVPSTRVSITFRASLLPEKVRLFCCVTRVQPFVQKVVFCQRCLRFNHKADNCKGYKRCQKCTERHDTEEEFEECSKKVRCLYCKAHTHATGSQACDEHKRQQQIKAAMSRRNLSFAEAREMFPITSPNMYDLLSNLHEHPTLAETVVSNNNLAHQWKETNRERVPMQAAVKIYSDGNRRSEKPQNKRRRQNAEAENQEAGTSNTGAVKKKEDKLANGVGLDNPFKVDENERWNRIIEEANRKAELNSRNKYQAAAMSFYSELYDEESMSAEMKERFKQIARKYFELNQAIA